MLECASSIDIFANIMDNCKYRMEEKLVVVELYFETPTFDLISKDAKTNFVTQVSMIGGTLGLFSGFSILTAFEIVYFITRKFFELYSRSRKG